MPFVNVHRRALTVVVLAFLRQLVGELSNGGIRRWRVIFGHDREDAIDDFQKTFLFVHLDDFDVRIRTLVQQAFDGTQRRQMRIGRSFADR